MKNIISLKFRARIFRAFKFRRASIVCDKSETKTNHSTCKRSQERSKR